MQIQRALHLSFFSSPLVFSVLCSSHSEKKSLAAALVRLSHSSSALFVKIAVMLSHLFNNGGALTSANFVVDNKWIECFHDKLPDVSEQHSLLRSALRPSKFYLPHLTLNWIAADIQYFMSAYS